MLSLLAAVALSSCIGAAAAPPAIAIIVDDLGNRPDQDFAAVEMPGLVSFAILPFAPLSRPLAEAAHAAGKEVFLHLPMEAQSNNHLLGPGALRSTMAYDEFIDTLRRALLDIPHMSGVNNHMGSRLTQDAQRMGWLMQELHTNRDLIYLDSRTTAHSAARAAARAETVPYLARDIFLDNLRDPGYIHARFDELVQHAVERGDAVGIAHPHPESLRVLDQRLNSLSVVRLVTVSAVLRLRECRSARGALKQVSIAAPAQRGKRRRDSNATEHPHADR